MSQVLMERVVQEVERLPESLQQKVLLFIQSLQKDAPKGIPGKELLEFAGSLDKKDKEQFEEALEECGQVDIHEW